ncbi:MULTISPECIES: DUF4870 domain-containing protein [Cellulomonas]|uniref:Membrane protein n=1 Tax=Cellulomonas oligotrophica TaxID=931536 RepID=A0A7Y9JWP7_9CELL|nr:MULTISPECIES: DUF4870 domain-containing protein [Cellulomonas]NYD85101.1 hypothetical protein [Cellulomonas oligotrophica]TQL03800.1 hypothetical protein FBY24_2905 [Cellulomonas sp. SLBN-39]GIG33805.1 membrane protein [Cellulomonas oligotrophica]
MSYPPPGPPASSGTPSSTPWAVLAHLGGILAYFWAGWVVALVVWLVHRERDHAVAREAAVALNFQLTVLVALVAARIVGEIPLLGFVGWVAAVALGIASLVLSVMAAVAVNAGRPARYPLSLELVR